MKKILTLLILFHTIMGQSFNADKIQFTLKSSKSVYLVDEPIYVECEFKNIGNTDVLCGFFRVFDPRKYKINFTTLAGDTIQYNNFVRIIPIQTQPVATLKPGESIYTILEMNEYFGTRSWDNILPATLHPEHYTLSFVYYSNPHFDFENDENGICERHPVTSDTIEFSIIKMNNEQYREWKLCKTAYEQTRFGKDPDEFFKRFNEYFDKYPDSEYDFQIPLLTLGVFRLELGWPSDPFYDEIKMNLTLAQILDKLKNHYAIAIHQSMIRKYTTFSKDIKEKIKVKDKDLEGLLEVYNYELNFVHQLYPGSLLEKYLKSRKISIIAHYKYNQEERERIQRMKTISHKEAERIRKIREANSKKKKRKWFR